MLVLEIEARDLVASVHQARVPVHLLRGDPDAALACAEEALALHRRIGALQHEVGALSTVAGLRMHRGELTPDEATDFLVEHTGFETANARAEVRRYTYTPGYQLSYLLGKALILGLREEEKRRRGASFSLREFHDTLLRNGSLPISFHRRLLQGEGA